MSADRARQRELYAERRAAGLCARCGDPADGQRLCEDCHDVELERERGNTLGNFGDPPVRLEDIAIELGISRERVRQIQDTAIAKVADQLGVDVADVWRGLAILGCANGERQ